MSRVSSKSYTKKAFLISFLAHSALFGSFILYKHYNPTEIKEDTKTVSMQLKSFELSKQKSVEPTKTIKKPTPKPIEKPIEKIKPKAIEKVKPIEKPKVITPAKVIEKPIPKPVEKLKKIEEIKEKTEPFSVEKTIKTEEEKLIEKQQQAKTDEQKFIKTNFSIIRHKVLSVLVYPKVAKRMAWVGVVELALIIDTNGKLIDAYIHKSSNRKLLDKAALKAAMKLKNQTLPKPQRVSTVILPVSFTIK